MFRCLNSPGCIRSAQLQGCHFWEWLEDFIMACEAAPVGGIEWYTGREMHRQEKTFQEYEKTHEMKVRNNPTCKGY